MTTLRISASAGVAAVLMVALAAPADALVRRADRPLLYHRTAVSGYYGYGYPVGEFASDREGDGNHDDQAPDWAVEIEHFVGRTTSIGFSVANTTYQDRTFPELETHLSTYSGIVRTVVPTGTAIRPYLRGGIGGVQVQFQDDSTRVDSEYSWSFQAGAGLLWLPVRWLGLSAQALFYFGDTEDAYIAENNTIVGFDCKYWAFDAGVSLFFP